MMIKSSYNIRNILNLLLEIFVLYFVKLSDLFNKKKNLIQEPKYFYIVYLICIDLLFSHIFTQLHGIVQLS